MSRSPLIPEEPVPKAPARVVSAARSGLADLFPGIAVSVLVAATAQFLSEHYGAPAMLLALLLGLALNFLAEDGTRTATGVALTARTVPMSPER